MVRAVSPLPDPARLGNARNIKVYTALVDIKKGLPGLRPGMTAQVDILLPERDGVLSVPAGAVLSSRHS